jgi:hypothetical protein
MVFTVGHGADQAPGAHRRSAPSQRRSIRNRDRHDPYHPYVPPWWKTTGVVLALLILAALVAWLAIATR